MIHDHADGRIAAVEVGGMTRGAFVLRGALAAAAVGGTAAVGPFVGRALAQGGGSGDVDILNFALTLEYLEAEFYAAAPAGLPGEARMLATEFGRNEQAHVEALRDTITKLGGTPVAKPAFTFPGGGASAYLMLAQTLEDTGVGAYNGAAPMIESKEVLAAAGSIVQVEARHAAAIRLLNEEPPAPMAFDEALEEQAVLTAVDPFIA